MRTKEALRTVAGSIVVYVIVAACSGAGDVSRPGAPDASSVGDALTGPVPDAKADEGASSGSRLKANRYVGSDGSSQFVGTFHDTQLNVDCTFQKASDGMTRCVPTSTGVTAYGLFFTDAGCTVPVASAAPCAPAPTQVAVGMSTGMCTSTSTTYSIGPVYSGPLLYEGGPSACIKVAPLAGYTYYSVGAVIPPPDPTQWVAATMQTDP